MLIAVRGEAGASLAAVRGLPGARPGPLALAALMGVTLNVCMFSAFGLISIALVLMLFYTYPAGVVIVDLVAGHERLSPSRVVALALSFGGVALVLIGGDGHARASWSTRSGSRWASGPPPARSCSCR